MDTSMSDLPDLVNPGASHGSANDNDSDPETEFQRKLLDFGSIYVRHKQVHEVEQDLQRLYKYGPITAKKGAAPCYLVTGDTGWGKSTLLRKFAKEHNTKYLPLQNVRPVLYLELKSTASKRGVAASILSGLGMPYPANATEKVLTPLAAFHLREQGVRICIIDEAQNFVDQENAKFSISTAEWLKGLLNEGACAFVFAGMPIARIIYTRTTQLETRSFGYKELKGFEHDNEDDLNYFKKALEKLLQNLPLPLRLKAGGKKSVGAVNESAAIDKSLFDLSEMLVKAFLAWSQGRIGLLVDRLTKACIFAHEGGLEDLELDDLIEAADRLRPISDPKWQNPFTLELPELEAELERLKTRSAKGAPLNLRKHPRAAKMKDLFPG